LARAAELVSIAPGEVHGGATQALVLCCCHLERRRCWTRERKKKRKKVGEKYDIWAWCVIEMK